MSMDGTRAGGESSPVQVTDHCESTRNTDLIVVGIGASAGGVEALEKLFVEMPQTLGMAFVVIQHLSPDFESLMPQILSRKTEMRVTAITDAIPLEPDHVYVLPSGKDARIENGMLVTTDHTVQRQQHPIDSFFASLAEDYRENAVAVILSGTGSDGSKGVIRIHDAGGLVVVQSELSSKFNGMPRAAIGTGIADTIVAVEEIPDALARFGEFTREPDGKSRQILFSESLNAEGRIHQLLHRKFGIDFDQYKTAMFGRRLARRMSLIKESEVDTYIDLLEGDNDELKNLYEDMLIGVTEFFRDPEAFGELQHRVLPGIIESAMAQGELRVWVAPCATGEEAYSLAILIDEMIQQRQISLAVKIFATDVNQSCIETASRGIYQKDRLANVSPSRLKKYFRKNEDGYLISSKLRKQIVFAPHDILQDAPFTKLNLVSCRNLLIYWKPNAKKKALSLFNFSLRESGILFLGPSESTTELESAYEAINEKWRIYRKIAPVRFSQVEMAINTPSKMFKRHCDPPAPANIKDEELTAVYDCLLEDYMPAGLLINQAQQVLHIFGDASEILQYRRGRPTTDLMQLLPASLKVAVTNGLKRVKVESKQVVYSGLSYESGGVDRNCRIIIKPVRTAYALKFLVTFEVFTPEQDEIVPAKDDGQNEGRNDFQDNVQNDTEAKGMLRSLEEELRETRESLHDSILNLKSTNEEMQSTNEELIASNEELQSTNEELHSVNEELYTVNSEHQRKITELTQMTDDMDNLLDSIQVDTIYLDRELRVRKFTLGIAKTFKLLPQDVGREFSSFNHELVYDNLIEKIENVLKTERSTDEEVQDKNGNWYLMRLLPYNSLGHIDGVLLTLIDISRIKQTEQQLEELSEIVQASADAIFRISMDGTIRTWNCGAVNLFMHQPEDAIGKSIEVLNLDKPSEDAVSHALNQITNGGAFDHVDLKASRRNGEEFDVQSTISPIYSSSGVLDGASIILRDVTAQKKAEQQIREEVRRRDHFLAVLSHELRNPTAAIMNASALLGKKSATSESHQRANGIISRHAKQLAKMMDDLLHVARVTHDKVRLDMKPTDLIATSHQVVECTEYQINEKKQILTLELPNAPLIRIVDKTRIIQAQTNLLVNASKYTPENGHLRFALWEEGDDIVFEVSDDGEGMSQELLPKIFDVFIQADQQLDRAAGGMGLGLPIVRMIAKAHGGTVTADSEGVGRGSTFTMRLPLASAEPTIAQEKPASDASIGSQNLGQKVLLIEDNDGARQMLAGYLELEKFTVQTARNGAEGIEIFQDFQPEICIVDIGLPDLNGFEVARKIKLAKQQPELLVALTGYGQSEDRHKAFEAGFDLHLVKPIQPDKLVATILENRLSLAEEN